MKKKREKNFIFPIKKETILQWNQKHLFLYDFVSQVFMLGLSDLKGFLRQKCSRKIMPSRREKDCKLAYNPQHDYVFWER